MVRRGVFRASSIWTLTLVTTISVLGVNSVSLRAHHEKFSAMRQSLDDLDNRTRIRNCVDEYAEKLDLIEDGLGGIIRDHPLVPATMSNRRVVIGAGSGNTGTHSIYHALQEFGLVTWHAAKNETWDEKRRWIKAILHRRPSRPNNLMRVLAECQNDLRTFNYTWLLDGCDAVVDMPTAEIFLNLFLTFPKARFILSVRPPESWAAARLSTHPGTAPPMQEPCGAMSSKEFSSATLANLYELNNELVRCLVPAERLLEINFWTDSPERSKGLMGEFLNFISDMHSPALGDRGLASKRNFPHIDPLPRMLNSTRDMELFRRRPGDDALVPNSQYNRSLDYADVEPLSCEERLIRHNNRSLSEYRDIFVEASELARMGCELI